MKRLQTLFITAIAEILFFTLLFFTPIHAATIPPNIAATTSKEGLSPKILAYAINGYRWAVKHNEVANPFILTIVDFKKPSNTRRLWVIDLKNDRVLMYTHVAQGKNTGKLYATRFSNRPGSDESSPGIYTTANVYDGEHGESMRVKGLEDGINNNAYRRAIVVHPAWYMTPDFIKQNGYAGRSWGCFALNPAIADKFIGLVKGGSVLFAYASPEKYDARVDHALSERGRQLYDAIVGSADNPVERLVNSL